MLNKNVYNPWENTKNFIQDTGNLGNFIEFLSKNNISEKNITKEYSKIEDKNEINIELLHRLNECSKLNYEVNIKHYNSRI
jgi:hypothetical protein